MHDGSESTEDDFEVVAKAGEKESQPAHIHITISSVNDEPPMVINNTGLFVWRGGRQLITPEHLGNDHIHNFILTCCSVLLTCVITPKYISISLYTAVKIIKNQIRLKNN